jgi:hypothetical protein
MDLRRVHVVCHRIVHGGPEPRPLIITEEELHHLDELSDLAPLYIPPPLLFPSFPLILSLVLLHPFAPSQRCEHSRLSGLFVSTDLL